MKQHRLVTITLMVLLLVAALAAPVLAAGTTEVRIAKFASDGKTVLNETTVDYHWLEANLPIQGDGVTRYYHQGPVFEGIWEDAHPDKPYDGWNPDEDVQMSMLVKADLGAVMGTDLRDICDYIGGAEEGDEIAVRSSDGWQSKRYPYEYIYDPDPRQGPAVLCWYSGNTSGPDAQEAQGQGYPDTGYDVGMRMVFFADTTTNPWGWHIFGNNDMKECWDKDYWNYGAQYPSAAGTSGKLVNEIWIYSQEEPPEPPIADFSVDIASGDAPLVVAFTDCSEGNPTSWSWTFGDGATSAEQNPVHTYIIPGVFTASLTVTNAAGSDTAEFSIIVSGESPGVLHIVKYANDNATVLGERTVDYHWLAANLPVQGDGVTRYYHQGPVTEAAWKEVFPYQAYKPWDPNERIESAFLDLGAVKGTDLAEICELVGGANDGDLITLVADGAALTLPYGMVYDPNPRQGPAVLCWYREGEGYLPDLLLAYFADNSTNLKAWHVFGNTDMQTCWSEAYWTYNGTLPSAASSSRDRVTEVRIESQEPPAPPVPSFSTNVTTGTPPLAVAFNDTSTGAPTAWSWDFGDGKTSTERNPVHVYAAPAVYPGIYTVTLTATNDVGTNITTVENCITVTAGYASFTANTTGGLPPLAVRFTDASTNAPTSWAWDFGDGATSTDQNPVHTYTAVGTHPVTLTITGSFGSDTFVTTEPIDMIRVLVPGDIGTTTLRVAKVAKNGTVLNETTVDYHWLEENLPVQGDGVTKYYHQWWIFDENPAYPDPDEANRNSVFNGKGRFGAVKGTDIKDICDLVGGASEGDLIHLNSRDGYKTGLQYDWVYNPHPRQGPATLCWYNAGGGNDQGVGYPDTGYFPSMRLIFFADNSTNPWGLHIFGIYDAYLAWGTWEDATTGWSAKWIDAVIIEVDFYTSTPVANFTADVTTGDAPLTVQFTDASTGGPDSWSWDFGDGNTSTDRNATHTYTAPGTYTANLTVENSAGSDSATATITVIEPGEPGETGTLTLHPGWNFVSTPKRLVNGANTFAIFKDVDTADHAVLLYDGITGWRSANLTTPFRPLDGAWVYANETCSIPLALAADGPELPPEKDLAKGWNAIGFTGTDPRTAKETLLSLGDSWTTLIGFDAQDQEYGVSILRGASGRHGEERPMYPMRGYWLYMTDAETLGAVG